MKNLNPKSIAFYISLMVAVTATVVALTTRSMEINDALSCFVVFAIVFLISYFMIYVALERFIYRKIKLVYKTIHNLKLNRFTKDILGKSLRSEDPLTDVQQEVQEWAEDSHKEIEGLKKAELYRKEFLSNLSHEFKTPLSVPR